MSIAQKDFSYMSDPALQQAMIFAQRSNDTPTFLALTAEANKRKQLRTAAQGQQGEAQQSGTVADQVMSGIANLTSGDHDYAHGGIVAFAGGGTPEDEYGYLPNESFTDRLMRRLKSAAKTIASPGQFAPAPSRYGAENTRGPIGVAPDGVDIAADSGAEYDPSTATRRAQFAPAATPSRPPTVSRKPGPVGAYDAATATRRSQFTSDGAVPASTAIAAGNTPTPEEIRAKVEALSAKDNEGISAVYKRMADRDAARQAKLAGETEDKAGILGFKMSPAVREALLNAGIGAMASKSTSALGGIGEGLAAGAATYKAGEKRRADRQDLLDEASDKRAMAEIAAKQGNQDRAAKLFGESEALKRHAQTLQLDREKIDQEERKMSQQERLALAQMENARKVAGMGSRNQQLELYTALGGGDPKKGYEFAMQAKGDPAADLAGWKAYASDPVKLEMLRLTDPNLYNIVKQKMQQQLIGGPPAAINGQATRP